MNFVPLADGNDLIVDASFSSISSNGTFVEGVSGGRLQTSFLDFSVSQQWYIAPQANGTVAIENAQNYMVIDESAGPDGLLALDQWYGGPTQEFYLIPGPSGVDIHGQPSNAVVGQPISPAITVAVVDAKGNTVTTNNSQLVTLAIAERGPANAQLLGTTTVRAVNGVADFTNLQTELARDLHTDRRRRRWRRRISPTCSPSHPRQRDQRGHDSPAGRCAKIGRANASRNGAEARGSDDHDQKLRPSGGSAARLLLVGSLPSGVTLANATGTYEGGSWHRDVPRRPSAASARARA